MLVFLAALVFFGAGLVGLLVFGPPVQVESGSWLEVRFSPLHPEQRPERTGMLAALEPVPLSQQDLLAALERVEDDPRVTGVLLRAEGFGGDWAQARELRDRLIALRGEGKRVVAHAQGMTSIDYYLATAAERIVLSPEGIAWIGGLQAELVFLRGTLTKLGVEVESAGVGEFKSAPEQFTQEGSSAESRVQVRAYLDEVFETWIEALSEARGLTRERMRLLVDRGLHDPVQAVEAGLVDELRTFTGLSGDLGDPTTMDVLTYLAAAGDQPGVVDDVRIALIHVDGTIAPGRSQAEGLGGAVAGSETIVRRLQRALDDDRVRAVVLRVDSPGGSALAAEQIHEQLERVRADKPVVVSMSSTAASGGYYVSMRADRILADPLTLTGSIGVFVLRPNFAGTYEKLDLQVETFARGENAGLLSPSRPWTPTQRALMQELLDRFYRRFVERVAEGRDMAWEDVDAVARGRVWSGRRALEAGLVDELGHQRDAIAIAADLAGIDPAVRPRIVTYQPEPDLLDLALARLFSDDAEAVTTSIVPDAVRRLAAVGSDVSTLADGTPQYALPWRLSVR